MITPNTSEEALLINFCQRHGLPNHYRELAITYLLPLARELAEKKANISGNLLVGINGCQGSGKSTLAALLSELLDTIYGLNVANLSIDDFYLTKNERIDLANTVHPLLITRGVPGTHDIKLLKETIDSLQNRQGVIPIPRFDKARDDRTDESQWDNIEGSADIILLEGWCVGVSAQNDEDLKQAINHLEQLEDQEGLWRKFINKVIIEDYEAVFCKLDILIMLKAPSFDCVYQWRTKQEEKLRQKLRKTSKNTQYLMDKKALHRFIAHYERLTKHMLAMLPKKADTVFNLNEDHHICGRIDNGKA